MMSSRSNDRIPRARFQSLVGFARQFLFPPEAGRGRPVSKNRTSLVGSPGDAAPPRRIRRIACTIEPAGRGSFAIATGVALLLSASSAVFAESSPHDGALSGVLDRLRNRGAMAAKRCLTPQVTESLQGVVNQGGVLAILGEAFKLEKVDIGGSEIALEIHDMAKQPFRVTLALSPLDGEEPDREGMRFLFYVSRSPTKPAAEVTAALLGVAELFDRSIPDSAIQRCGGSPGGPDGSAHGAPPEEDRYPLSLALTSAVIQLAVLLAAVVYGLYVLRSVGAPEDIE